MLTAVRPLWKNRLVMIFAAATAALMLGVLIFALTDPGRSGQRKTYMNQAAVSYQEGDYDAALRMLRRAAQIQVDDACLLLMADCYEAQGNLDKALELMRQIQKEDQSVTDRIFELEQRKRLNAEKKLLTVAGRQVAPDVSVLNLDNMDLDDSVLPEIAQLYALSSLSLMNNRLTELSPLSALGGLDTLNLAGNQISDVSPLAALQDLHELYLDDNPVADLKPLYSLTGLSMLSLCGMEIETAELDALAAALPGCAIRSDTPKSTTRDITLGGLTFKSDAEELDLSGLKIHDISSLAECRRLKWLNVSNNEISDLTALMNLPLLERLDISGNQVTDLRPIMGLGSLRQVYAADNQVVETSAVGAMAGLEALDLSNNPIRDFSGLRKLYNLHALRLVNTGLADKDLAYFENLNVLANLWLDENTGLSNEAMGRLQSALPDCAITYTQLVYTVEIGGVSVPSDSAELKMNDGLLMDLAGFDKMNCLEVVDLSHNVISNIYLLQYSPSRDTIRVLDLSDNRLIDVTALSALTAIEELDLRRNQIGSIQPLLHLETLERVYLAGNLLSETQIEQLRAALPNCEVSLED